MPYSDDICKGQPRLHLSTEYDQKGHVPKVASRPAPFLATVD